MRRDDSEMGMPSGTREAAAGGANERGQHVRRGRATTSGEVAAADLYRALVEMAPDATVVAGSDGLIRLVNRQTEVLFDYARAELLGQPIELLIPERFRHVHTGHRDRYVTAPRTRPMGSHLQLSGRRRDGSEFPVEVSLSPVAVDGETLVIASVRDIGELQRVQAARQAAETANEELRRLQALTDTALSHLDLGALLPELLARARAVLGVENAAILLLDDDGTTLRIRVASGPEEAVAGQVRVSVGSGFAGQIAATRRPLIVDDLAAFPVVNAFLREGLRSAVGVPLVLGERLLGVLHVGSVAPRRFGERDVALLQRVADRVALAVDRAGLFEAERAARQDAEDALSRARASEEEARHRSAELHAILETMTDGVVVYDAHGRITDVNAVGRALLGEADGAAEIAGAERGETVRSASFYTDDAQPVPPDALPLARILRGEVLGDAGEDYVLRAGDGRRARVSVGGAPLRDAAGAVVGAVLALRDVTERRRLEREREEARAREAAALEVNARMDEFLATAAHDIRNPIAVVKGYTQLALTQSGGLSIAVSTGDVGTLAGRIAAVRESLSEADRSSDRLVRLSARLFDVVRAHAGRLELHLVPCDLAALVREVVAAQCVATPERAIHLHAPEGSVPVLADEDRLAQVLTNYLTNAIKYSPPDRPVAVTLEAYAGLVSVGVRDEGPGLSLLEQVRVWEMFHRAPGVAVQSDAGGESLGLGLHICKRIVELHHGQVGVESDIGHGATFWFTLPLAQHAAGAASDAPAS